MSNFKDTKAIKYCGNCGKELIENAVFCAYCGFSLETGKTKEEQNRKLTDFSIPTNVQDYSITHQERRLPFTDYQIERSRPRPFFQNFKGAIVSPKTDFPLITSKPNLLQPLILNIIIGILSGVAMLIMLDKVKITLSQEFFDSLTTGLDSSGFNINELEQIMALTTPIMAPIESIIRWILYSSVLWIIVSIFASSIASSDRNFKKMATITGWAQIPMILQQIASILVNFFFLTEGEIIYESMTDVTIVSGGEISPLLNFLLQGVQTLLLLWSILLIYYGIKSLGSMNTSPTTICMIYGIAVFVITILPYV
jgi:hypothetical protein